MNLQLPLFEPTSEWKSPEDFPDLDSYNVIGLDVETRDPRLKELGPGSLRKDGRLCGISIGLSRNSDQHTESFYFPIAHEGDGNCNKEAVVDWLKGNLRRKDLTVVGANILYDVEWLASEGIEVNGPLIDISMIEALIEEEAGEGFSLNALSNKYLGAPKNEDLLREAAKAYGIDPKSGMWMLPPKYVGPYAEWDALGALLVWQKQSIELAKQGLNDIAKMEMELTPIIWKMRRNGCHVDIDQGAKLGIKLGIEEERIRKELKSQTGRNLDVWSSKQLSQLCQSLNIDFPRTGKGNPSFTKEFIEHHEHPVLQLVKSLREVNRLREVFVDDWIDKHVYQGKVYPNWRQLASDDGGTRTGRMASANPNMQQIPSRAEIAKEIRALFVPPSGQLWGKADYSQQEPRILVHYAAMMGFTGADIVARQYCDNPLMDIYGFLGDMGKISRKKAKGATLGRMYGMGAKKYAQQQGVSVGEGYEILESFDKNVPFVRELADRCASLADNRGYIRTLGGRKRHFNLWEKREFENCTNALPRHLAEKAWPGEQLRRAGSRKALNALIQGSAADMTKRAIIEIYKQEKLVPILQVHDELDLAVDTEAQMTRCKKIMEGVFKLRVPIIAEVEIGAHWK